LKLTIDSIKWFALKVVVVGAALSPFIYHGYTSRLYIEQAMLFFALEVLVAVSTSFTVFVFELWYKTRKAAERDSTA
jgi:hypothetical protein